jgi:hypothetical protein
MFNPPDQSQTEFNGYGPSTLPNERDVEVDDFLNEVISGGEKSVAEILPKLSEKARRVLRAYAGRMASLAVQRQDRAILTRGLVAVVLGGLDENQLESLMVMAPIEDSARRIGIEPADLFEEVSKIVGLPATVNLMIWLSRTDDDRSLESMGYVTTEDEGGFRYRLNW